MNREKASHQQSKNPGPVGGGVSSGAFGGGGGSIADNSSKSIWGRIWV